MAAHPLSKRSLEPAAIAAFARPYTDPQRFKYFAGVCWRKIREAE